MRLSKWIHWYVLGLALSAFLIPLSTPPETYAAEQDAENQGQPGAGNRRVRQIDVQVGGENINPVSNFSSDEEAPFAEIRALQARIQRLFEESMNRGLHTTPQEWLFPSRPFEPAVNIEDQGTVLNISADLPGLRKQDIEITLQDDLLTIRGRRQGGKEEQREERGRKVYTQERFEGSFKRSIRLPVPVKEDSVKARYDQGVLVITAVKEEIPAEQTKRIRVE